jgi:hypothetical protein
VSGYCFYFLDSLVSWSARKQRIVSTSSTESEYYALTNTIKEAICIKLFLSLTSLPSPTPFPIFCDNQSTCTIANTDSISSRTKHIDVRHHFIRQHLNDGPLGTSLTMAARLHKKYLRPRKRERMSDILVSQNYK